MGKRLSEDEFDRLLALWADEIETRVMEWNKAQAERFRVPSTGVASRDSAIWRSMSWDKVH